MEVELLPDADKDHTESLPLDLDAAPLTRLERFWRNRLFARVRHRLTALRRTSGVVTRFHARVIGWSGGRIRRSFLFTGGMPVLVLTTVGRRTGKMRSTPLGYLRIGTGFAVLASNAGNDCVPAWWLNLQADPYGRVLAAGRWHDVKARAVGHNADEALWRAFEQRNPGFDEYRRLTQRHIPIVLLEPTPPSR